MSESYRPTPCEETLHELFKLATWIAFSTYFAFWLREKDEMGLRRTLSEAIWLGAALGLVAYAVVYSIFQFIMLRVFRCEKMFLIDNFFIHDSKENQANIMGAVILDEFELDEMREHLFKKCQEVHKMNAKLIHFLGEYYFKKMSRKEFNAIKEQIIMPLEDVHSEDDLHKFMCGEQNKQLPMNTPLFRFWLVPDYQDGKSAVVAKLHHAMADGLGIAHFVLHICDQKDVSAVPGIRKFSLLQNLLVAVTLPFFVLKESLIAIFFDSKDYNAISNGQPLTGIKRASHRELNVSAVKRTSKQMQCSVNDFLFSLVCVSLRTYLEEKRADPALGKFEVPEKMQIMCPYSVREPVKSPKDVVMTNAISILKTRVKLLSSFEEQVEHIREYYRDTFSLLETFGVAYAIRLTCLLPFQLNKFLTNVISNKKSLTYSNLNMSDVPFNIGGKKFRSMFFYSTSTGDNNCAFLFCRAGDFMSMTAFSDIAKLPDPDRFMDIFQSKYEAAVSAGKEA